MNTVNCPPRRPTTGKNGEGGGRGKKKGHEKKGRRFEQANTVTVPTTTRPRHGRDPVSTETIAQGRYRVERPLGNGAMANVVLAHDEELGRLVAIKLLDEQLAAAGDFRARFTREGRLAAGLSHPNIVTVFDAGEVGGRPYIVMEYVDGATLEERCATRSTDPDEVRTIAQQVAAGLEHAPHGLVHRDLKPGNLIQRSDGTVKIADFGIARGAWHRAHGGRHHPRNRCLPRSGASRGRPRHAAHRPLCARRRAIRAPDRRAALAGGLPRRHRAAPHRTGARPSVPRSGRSRNAIARASSPTRTTGRRVRPSSPAYSARSKTKRRRWFCRARAVHRSGTRRRGSRSAWSSCCCILAVIGAVALATDGSGGKALRTSSRSNHSRLSRSRTARPRPRTRAKPRELATRERGGWRAAGAAGAVACSSPAAPSRMPSRASASCTSSRAL